MFKRSLRNEVTTLQIGKFIKRLIKKDFWFFRLQVVKAKTKKNLPQRKTVVIAN